MSGMNRDHSCSRVERLVNTTSEYLRHFQTVGDPLKCLNTFNHGNNFKLWEIRSQTRFLIRESLKVQRLDGNGFEKISSLRYSPFLQEDWGKLIGEVSLIPIRFLSIYYFSWVNKKLAYVRVEHNNLKEKNWILEKYLHYHRWVSMYHILQDYQMVMDQ